MNQGQVNAGLTKGMIENMKTSEERLQASDWAQPATAGGLKDKPMSESDMLVEQMNKTHAIFEQIIDELYRRLDPILTPEPPKEALGNSRIGLSAPLFYELDQIDSEIKNQAARLASIIGRLAI